MNQSSNAITEVDPITVTEQRPSARVRPERPVRRLRRGTSSHPPTTQESAKAGETARKREADGATGVPTTTMADRTSAPKDLLQPSTPSSQDWTTSAAGPDEHDEHDEHDEYDALLAAVLSDDDAQTGNLEDLGPAAEAPDLGARRDVAAGEAAAGQADEGPGALAQTERYPTAQVEEVEGGESGGGAPNEGPSPDATARGPRPPQRIDSSSLEEPGLSRSPQVPPAAADAVNGDASALASESLPASRTRARRGRAASTSAAPLQKQPAESPLAPMQDETTEPAPLPAAPLYLWQGATLLPAPTGAQSVSAPASAISTSDLVPSTAATVPVPAEGLSAPHITDAVDAPTATAMAPSTDLPEAHDRVGAAPSTTVNAELDERTAPAAATEAVAGETTSNAADREVIARQTSVPGAALDTAAFVRQVRDAELRDAAPVLSPVHAVPDGGWRSAVMKLTLGRVQPSPSARQAERDHEIYRVRTPLNGNRHIVVLAYGTGVGKTLTTGAIGLQFAEHRDDRVAVIDADQTAGNLADRFATPADRFLQNLLDSHQHSAVESIVELRCYARSAKRLDIYSADHTRTYTAQQHRDALALLSRFHDVVITDLGSSGLRDMPEVLQTATDVVVVTGTSMDAVDRSRKVLDRLEELGHERLAREAVVAMVTRTTKDGTLAKAARNGGVHVETLIGHFQKRCRATVLIPYSARLADGVHVDYETLDSDVNEAYLRIAGFLANGFRPAPDRQNTPEGAGFGSRAQLTTLRAVVSTTTPMATAKIKFGRGGRKKAQTPAPSAFAELPHYQGS